MSTYFVFFCTLISHTYAQTPLSSAPYSPIVGNIECNTRINGSTDENDFNKVYWSFHLDENIDAVQIDSCSSKYNTKLRLYHYFNTTDNRHGKTGWLTPRDNTCDDCLDRICYPNELWTWNLDHPLAPGYYFLEIGGFADHVGDYNVFLKCDEITPVYISKTGIDSPNCGLLFDNPCATLYYASTLIVNDYMELYVSDGQNATQIAAYQTNQTGKVNYCLPFHDIEYIYYIYFDAVNIQTMTDWYPPICVNKNQSEQYMFEHFTDLKFENLIIDNYVFNNQGIIKTETNLECFNCSFINLTFNFDYNEQIDVIYAKVNAFIKGSNFEMINVFNPGGACNFIQSQIEINFQHNTVSNIIMDGNGAFIHTNVLKRSYVTDSTFTHINTYSLLLFERTLFASYITWVDNKFHLENCNFIDINSGAIMVSNHPSRLILYIYDVSISTSQLYDVENEVNYYLFYFNPTDLVMIDNLVVDYKYSLIDNCYATERDSTQISHDYIIVLCKNPITLFRSLGRVIITNMFLSNGINNQTIFDYNKYILSTLNYSDITVNYVYETVETGLLHNSGFLDIYNMTIDTVTFHDKLLYIYFSKTVLIDGVSSNYFQNYCNNGIDCSVFNPNTLRSSSWIYVGGAVDDGIVKTTVNITNSYIAHVSMYGIYFKWFKAFSDIYISNTTFSDMLMAIWLRYAKSLTIKSTDFARIGRLYNDKQMYYYNPFDSHEKFKTIQLFRCDTMHVENSNFLHYNPNGYIYLFNVKSTFIKKNVFELNMDNLSMTENYPLEELLVMYRSPAILIDNYFGVNTIVPTIPWIRQDDCRDAYLTCISGNTFHGYAIRTEDCNITSCYREQTIECLHSNMCCNDANYGMINSEHSQRGIFILNDSDVMPLSIEGGSNAKGATYVVIDNVEFQIYDNRKSIAAINDGNVLILDSDIYIDSIIYQKDMKHFSYLTEQCNISCNELYLNSETTTIINELSIKCGLETGTNEFDYYFLPQQEHLLSYTIDHEITEYINHLSASHLELTVDDEYFAGSFMKINFEIKDKYGNIINKTEYKNEIIIILSNDKLSFYDELIINNNSVCARCDSGIYIPSITLSDIGKIFEINVSIYNNKLLTTNLNISVSKCPSGYGENELGTQCVRCTEGHFALLPGQNSCYSCDEENNNGIKCHGGNHISIIQNYWIAIKNITQLSTDDELLLFGKNKKIISAFCPYGYCPGNYDYDHNTATDQCAKWRNPNIPLCGECMNGYSASMSSLQCIKCDKNANYSWLVYPILLAIFISFFLIISKLERTTESKRRKNSRKERKHTNRSNMVNILYIFRSPHLINIIGIIMFKIILYYEQMLVQIIDSGAVVISLASFASLFNVSIEFIRSDMDNQMCFIAGLTLKGKILTGFISIATIILILFIVFILSLIFPNKIKCCNRKPNLGRSVVSMLLLCIGKILSILFKLLSCQSIGDASSVHYYFGGEKCYGATWFLAFFLLIIVIAVFGIIFIALINMDEKKRQSKQHILASLTKAYHPKYYYWEGVIFIRRVVVAFFAISLDNWHYKFILFILLNVFILCQYYCQPFIIKQANEMELILLICLIIVVFTQIVYSTQSFAIITSLIISFLILLPFILLLIFIVIEIKKIKYNQNLLVPNNTLNATIKQRIKYFMLCVIMYYSQLKPQHSNKMGICTLVKIRSGTDTSDSNHNESIDVIYDTDHETNYNRNRNRNINRDSEIIRRRRTSSNNGEIEMHNHEVAMNKTNIIRQESLDLSYEMAENVINEIEKSHTKSDHDIP